MDIYHTNNLRNGDYKQIKELNDEMIINEAKHNRKIKRISFAIVGLILVVLIIIFNRTLNNTFEDIEKKYAMIAWGVISIFCIIVFIFLYIKEKEKYNWIRSDNWKVTTAQLWDKKMTYSRDNSPNMYYLYFGVERIEFETMSDVYYSIENGDKAYLVVDNEDIIRLCFPLKQYKYIGSRMKEFNI